MTKQELLKLNEQRTQKHEKYVQRQYNLAPGEYAERLAAQGGVCAICGKAPRKRFLAVDHDHRTGAVRGLLCYFCNSSIGTFEFDKGTALRAATYLQKIGESIDEGSNAQS